MQTPSSQNGAASIEFAFSFIVLFMLFYGIVGYTMPLLLGASYQQLASDSLREGIAWQGHRYAADDKVQEHVKELIEQAWMPSEWAELCEGEDNFLTIHQESGIWEVCLRHSQPNSIMPPINLMGWQFPQLPDQIVGFATMHTLEDEALKELQRNARNG